MKPEAGCCEARIQPGVQGRGGSPGARTGCERAQASRDIDVHENVLRKWVKEFGSDPKQAFPGHGRKRPEQLEIERLRREVTKLKAERDILKKAAAYFAKESI